MMNAELTVRRSATSAAFRRILPLVLYAAYAAVLGAVVWTVDYVPAERLRETLKMAVPLVLRANLLLAAAGVALCAKDIVKAFSSLNSRQGLALAGAVAGAVVLVVFVAPRTHRIYYDEDIYGNVGQTIAEADQAAYANYALFQDGAYKPIWTEYNKEPAGWPFLLSLFFTLFGTNEAFLFVANNMLFAGSMLLVFFLARQCTGTFFPAMAAAMVYGLIPHNLVWFNTGAVEPSAAFFGAAVALAAFSAAGTGKNRHLFVLAMLIPLASHMRPESLMIYFWAVVALLFERPRLYRRYRAWGWAFVTLLLLTPVLLHFSAMGGESWGAQGAKFSFSFAAQNLAVNGPYYFNGIEFPTAFSVLALVGLLAGKTTFRRRFLLLFWFALFWSIFLFFYAGSYDYGADERFALMSFAPLAVLAGLGTGRLRDLLASQTGKRPVSVIAGAALVLIAAPFLPQVNDLGEEAWRSHADHRYARQFAEEIPKKSVVLTHIPTMFLLWGNNAIQTYAGVAAEPTVRDLLRRFPGNVYFHYNYWCNTSTVRNRRLCGAILTRYDVELVDRATEGDSLFALYRIKGFKKATGGP
jgi:hypothetical protein